MPQTALLKQLASLHSVPADAVDDIRAAFEEVVLPKGELLVREGQVCRHLYFLQSGALRGYYLLDGKEVTHWFAIAEEFVTSFYSFSTGGPAVENLQLLEGSVLWAISRQRLDGLLARHPGLERLLRIAYERYYVRLEERFVNAQFRTAAERYRQLRAERPEVLERIPLGHIASWLGISPETLSRIRAQR